MIGNGEWIFMAVLLITLAALAYGLFTAEGSGITPRPWGSRRSSDPQPGAVGPEEVSGHDEREHVPWGHGTK